MRKLAAVAVLAVLATAAMWAGTARAGRGQERKAPEPLPTVDQLIAQADTTLKNMKDCTIEGKGKYRKTRVTMSLKVISPDLLQLTMQEVPRKSDKDDEDEAPKPWRRLVAVNKKTLWVETRETGGGKTEVVKADTTALASMRKNRKAGDGLGEIRQPDLLRNYLKMMRAEGIDLKIESVAEQTVSVMGMRPLTDASPKTPEGRVDRVEVVIDRANGMPKSWKEYDGNGERIEEIDVTLFMMNSGLILPDDLAYKAPEGVEVQELSAWLAKKKAAAKDGD